MDRKTPEFAGLPIPALFRRLLADVSDLIRAELRLARAELTEKGRAFGKTMGTSIALFIVAALLGLGAFVTLTIALIALVALALPLWGAALVVTAVYVIGAAVVALAGKNALSHAAPPVPAVTIASVRADAAAISAGVRAGR